MKHLIVLLLTIGIPATAAFAQKKNAVRLELASAISTRIIRMTIGHQISDKWSIAAETGLNINRILKDKDHETTTHWNTLSVSNSSGSERTFRDNFTEVSLYAQYWVTHAYEGPVFCMGGTLKDRSGSDIITSIGYTFNIWNGLRADLLYNLHIIESIKTGNTPSDNIRIGISYVF